MSKYPCPKCKAQLSVDLTFEKRIHISCTNCNLYGLFDDVGGFDVAVMEFGCRYDDGELDSELKNLTGVTQSMVKSESDIAAMIKDLNPDELTKSVLYSKKDYISCYKMLSRREPRPGRSVYESGIDGRLSDALINSGISRFYKFQNKAIESVLDGKSLVIEAPTASGKTEAFLIPVLHMACTTLDSNSLILVVYPTKSLARDQYSKIEKLASSVGLDAAVFDGDVKTAQRSSILSRKPDILVTNFDVLHYHMMHHTPFSSMLSKVRFVVVDEVHVYTGIFGSNVHYIIKRLKRLANEKIQFIAASATLRDSGSFCTKLFDADIKCIHGDGIKSKVDFVMMFPSLRTQRSLMIDLVKKLIDKKHKTMVFSGSHQGAELIAVQAKKLGIPIKVHRAGLSSGYRMAVENEFRNGQLRAISCTSTMELGIDVGDVDGVVSSMVPINRLMQRIGRSARSGKKGFAFLALGSDPISQYYKNHPEDYFEDEEEAYIDPKNPFVQESQVLAMASDRAILPDEVSEYTDTIQKHCKTRHMILHGGRYTLGANGRRFLSEYSIRGIGKHVDIVLNGKHLGERALPMALEELHNNAIYFLAGRKYIVKHLAYPNGMRARIEAISNDYPYYTKALTDEWPIIKKIYEQKTVFGTEIAFCSMHIKKTIHGYASIKLGDDSMQGQKTSFDKPLHYDFETKGIVFHAPYPEKCAAVSKDPEYVTMSGYHAAEHVVIEGSNMVTGGASQDLGGISLGGSGLVFVYDGAIGGSGASRALYERFEDVLLRSKSIVKECPCSNEAGCPRCTFSYRCGNNNEYLHKASALEIFNKICSGEKTTIIQAQDGERSLV